MRRWFVVAGAILAAVASTAGCGSCGDKGERYEGEAVDGGFLIAWDGGGRHRRMRPGRNRLGDAGEAPEAGANPVDAGAHPD